ncbi:MAG TPA: hypothetical protein VFZ52_16050 [Chryseolinea sp.]
MWFVIASGGASFGQDVIVRGGFFADSLRVGDQSGYYLSATYPRNLNIVFPDSTFDYFPFELNSRRYFPTKTENGKSYDSVVYYLSTFEVDRLQQLALPVFQVNPQDCTIYTSSVDTVLLAELAKNIPDTIGIDAIALRVNTEHENVPYLFNYPVLFIVLAALLVLSLGGWIFFGKRIRRYFRLKRMSKAHLQFLETYNQHVNTIRSAFSSTHTEYALAHWKKYMEQLEARPYTKLTSRETSQLENDETLGKNLHSIDGAIYGHNTTVVDSLETLKQYADQKFAKKLEEVKHG